MTIPQAVIESSITEVFETMYFVSPSYQGILSTEITTPGIAVDFSGDVRGQFRLYYCQDVARRMASEFLASEEDLLKLDEVEGTIRELANVACGSTLSAWLPDVRFDYGVPHTIPGNCDEEMHAFAVFSDQPEICFGVVIDSGPDRNDRV